MRREAGIDPLGHRTSRLSRKLDAAAKDPTYIFTQLRVRYRMPKGETQEPEGVSVERCRD